MNRTFVDGAFWILEVWRGPGDCRTFGETSKGDVRASNRPDRRIDLQVAIPGGVSHIGAQAAPLLDSAIAR